MKTVQILLIEDDRIDRNMIRDTLEKYQNNFVVNEAASLADVNKLIRTKNYNLILVNPNVGGYGGMKVLESINSKMSGVPVILLCPEDSKIEFIPKNNDTQHFFVKKTNFIDNLPNTVAFVLERQQIVTQFKKEHSRMQRLNRYFKTMRQLKKLAFREENRDSLLKTTCQILNETAKYSYAWIGVFEENSNIFKPLNWPENKKRLNEQAFMCFGEFFKSNGLFEVQKEVGNYFVCDDILVSTQIPNTIIGEFKDYIRSFITIPICLDKEMIGLFTIQSREPYFFCEEDLSLLGELIDDISYILSKIHAADLNEEEKQELVEAMERAEQSDRLKSAFLMNISHEIRTPMNGIIGFTELLGEEDLRREQVLEYIEIISDSSRRMLDTINNLISISKIEAGDIKLNETIEDLNSLLKDVSDVYRMNAEEKGLGFYFVGYEPGRCIRYKTDKLLFQFIISNLLTNAIKFTYKGYIEFGYSVNSESIEIFVRDTGVGIDEKKFELIFDKFRQGDEGHSRQFEGSGLGLTIAKAYAEKLKGKIRVESVLGKGTVFYFTLPLIRRKGTNIQVVGRSSILKEKSIKALIVEDDAASAKLLKAIMNGFTNEILHARNGEEAVNICRGVKDIDLIIMDLQMSGTDGLEATRQIRVFNKDVIIIAHSAYTMAQHKKEALAVGCNDFINKPILRGKFLSTIHKYFQNHSFGRQDRMDKALLR